MRILLGLVLIAVGTLGAGLASFEMMLTAAYGAWGIAFVSCLGAALGTAVMCLGGYVTLGRAPGFMRYVPPVPAASCEP